MSIRYPQGSEVRVSVTFRTGTSYVDPDAVFVSFQPAGGDVTIWQYGVDDELVRDTTGRYHADIDANAAGEWTYRCYSTGVGKAAVQGRFTVIAAAPAP